jgi:hypothetical protein
MLYRNPPTSKTFGIASISRRNHTWLPEPTLPHPKLVNT